MTRPLPSLRLLEAFEAAVRLRSYSRAAAALGVTHGAVSHRIRELEALVGTALFMRAGNEMHPTEAGRQLMPQVAAALSMLRAAFPPQPAARPGPQLLRLSVLPSLASRWLVPRLGQFRAAHPGIGLALDARLDHAALGPGGQDLAIRYGRGDWPGLRAERIAGEVLFPVCAPAYRDRLGLTTPADLARCVLLQHSWQPWADWLRHAGVTLAAPAEGPAYADAGLLLEAAAAGEGVALARGLLAAPDLASGRLVRPWDIALQDGAAYHLLRPGAPSAKDQAIDSFRDWLVPRLQAACAAASAG